MTPLNSSRETKMKGGMKQHHPEGKKYFSIFFTFPDEGALIQFDPIKANEFTVLLKQVWIS